MIKIIKIVKHPLFKHGPILLVAPFPFLLKCRNIFENYSIATTIIKQFPVKTTASPQPQHPNVDVVIMNLYDFFGVDVNTLMSYDLCSYNVFVDDIQQYKISDNLNAMFPEIATFFNQLCAIGTNKYIWCAIDILQCPLLNPDGTYHYSGYDNFAHSLLYVNKSMYLDRGQVRIWEN